MINDLFKNQSKLFWALHLGGWLAWGLIGKYFYTVAMLNEGAPGYFKYVMVISAVGAVLTRKAIYEKTFSSLDRAVVHSSTFGQGSLAMVAGLASLDALDEDGLIENAAKVGEKLGSRLLEMKDRFEFIHDVRWRGLMLGIERAC